MNLKRILFTTLFAFVMGASTLNADSGKVVGTQCWINGKLVGGFPPGYICPGTGGGSADDTTVTSNPSTNYALEYESALNNIKGILKARINYDKTSTLSG